MSNAGEPFRRGWGNPSNPEGHISVEDVRYRAYRSNFGLYQLTRLFVDTCRRQNPRRRRLCHLAMQLWMEKLYAKGFERFRSLRWYPPQLQRVRADLEARIDSLAPIFRAALRCLVEAVLAGLWGCLSQAGMASRPVSLRWAGFPRAGGSFVSSGHRGRGVR